MYLHVLYYVVRVETITKLIFFLCCVLCEIFHFECWMSSIFCPVVLSMFSHVCTTKFEWDLLLVVFAFAQFFFIDFSNYYTLYTSRPYLYMLLYSAHNTPHRHSHSDNYIFCTQLFIRRYISIVQIRFICFNSICTYSPYFNVHVLLCVWPYKWYFTYKTPMSRHFFFCCLFASHFTRFCCCTYYYFFFACQVFNQTIELNSCVHMLVYNVEYRKLGYIEKRQDSPVYQSSWSK